MSNAVMRAALGAGAVALLLAGPAAAQVSVPGCDALVAWGATVDPADTFEVAPALPLPKALADDRLVPLLGKPALALTREDINAAGKALTGCYNQARKARDTAAQEATTRGKTALATQLARTLAALDKARAEAEKQKAAVDALPDSPELAQGLGILVDGDPAAPDVAALQALPRPAADPLLRLVRVLPHLGHADRAPLYAALAERRSAIGAGMAGEARQAVAAAPADADGLLTLQALRQRLSGLDAAEAAAIDRRMGEIRQALRVATPATWTPPDCTELYRWSGAEGADQRVTVGVQTTMAAFLDDRAVPVFGVALADWSDADMARFKTLRGLCQAQWQALPEAATVRNPAADAPELIRLAAKGRWIDTADQWIEPARAALATYRAAAAELDATLARVEALPDATESLPELQQLAQLPALSALGQDDRRRLQAAVNGKRQRIGIRAAEEAMAGFDSVDVADIGDIVKLVQYGNQAVLKLPDANGRQRVVQAMQASVAKAALRLAPAFKSRLDALPATREGLAEAGAAVGAWTGVGQTETVQAFAAFHGAAALRAQAIAAELHAAHCQALHKALDLGDKAARQPIWGAGAETTLGELVCAFAEGGTDVHEYKGGGLFSSTQSLKVTLAMLGLQTITLHKGEATAGKTMLVGQKLADANQERMLTVQEWAEIAGLAVAKPFLTRSMCDPVMHEDDARLSIPDRMLAVQCTLEAMSGRLF